MNHTPTPWAAIKRGVNNDVVIVPADRERMSTSWILAECREQANDAANAAYIVHAVNSHAALVKALQPLAVWAENERRKHNAMNEENEAVYMGTLADNARAALALAEGKEQP